MAVRFKVVLTGIILLFAQIANLSACSSNEIEQLRLKLISLEQKIQDNQHRLENALEKISKKLSKSEPDPTAILFPDRPAPFEHPSPYNCSCDNGALDENQRDPFETCMDAKQRGLPSGRYFMKLPGKEKDVLVAYCDQTTAGGGWLVVQNRVDAQLSFVQNWDFYKTGFGEGDKNYWIGLEYLHRLTASRRYELRVELMNSAGTKKYAEYDDFEVGSATEYYKLKTLGTYSGTAGNDLAYHRGASFSTYDQDHDSDSAANCAAETRGGWWLYGCRGSHWCNLNGAFDGSSQQSIVWWSFNGYSRLYGSRMLIRAK